MKRNSIVHKEFYGFSGKFHCAVWSTVSYPILLLNSAQGSRPSCATVEVSPLEAHSLHRCTAWPCLDFTVSHPCHDWRRVAQWSANDRTWASRDVTSRRLLTFYIRGHFCFCTFSLLPPSNSKPKFQSLSSLHSFLILKLMINTHPGRVCQPLPLECWD